MSAACTKRPHWGWPRPYSCCSPRIMTLLCIMTSACFYRCFSTFWWLRWRCGRGSTTGMNACGCGSFWRWHGVFSSGSSVRLRTLTTRIQHCGLHLGGHHFFLSAFVAHVLVELVRAAGKEVDSAYRMGAGRDAHAALVLPAIAVSWIEFCAAERAALVQCGSVVGLDSVLVAADSSSSCWVFAETAWRP